MNYSQSKMIRQTISRKETQKLFVEARRDTFLMKILLTILLIFTFSIATVRADEADDLRKAEIRYLRMMRSRQRRVERLQRQARGRMQLQIMMYGRYMQMSPRYYITPVIHIHRPYYYPRYRYHYEY